MKLRARSLDFVLVRCFKPHTGENDDLTVDAVFEDYLVIVCGRKSRFAWQKSISLADLADEAWVATPADSANSAILMDAFRRDGLAPPSALPFCRPIRLNCGQS